MDRRYRAPDNVNVYATRLDRDNQIAPIKTLKLVPYSLFGCDNYLVDDVMYPGYFDGDDACVFLDRPLKPPARTTT